MPTIKNDSEKLITRSSYKVLRGIEGKGERVREEGGGHLLANLSLYPYLYLI